jgi:ATP-dependent Lon protease
MPLPSKMKKSPPPQSDSENESVDEKGNVKNLIDYEYDESSTITSEPKKKILPRKAKKDAQKKIRRVMKEEDSSYNSSNSPSSKPRMVVESEEDEPKKQKGRIIIRLRSKSPKKPIVEESEEESEDYDESEDSEEYSEEYDSEEDYEEESEEDVPRKKGMTLLELLNGEDDPRKPKKYNLKKESANVRRFVELVQHEDEEEDNIDNDITYFKSLSPEKQASLMAILEQKAAPVEVQVPLKFKILEKVASNPEMARIAMSKYSALMNIDPSSTEYYKCSHWINGFTQLPLGVYKDLPVKLEDGPEKCQEFMNSVHKCMEGAIYGHDEAKLQIMQFVSSWIANPKAHGNVLSIHGPPGVGKTSLIKDGVAKALGRPFHFITLGGATDASFLDGHSYTYEGSTWGKIVDVLMQSKCMNPVIYFDELDKVSETPKGEEIMNMLIHITDGSQNDRFQDKYFTGINLDLSRCLFIFSHNDHGRVNPILRDRMYNIEVKGFDSKQKLIIAEKYLVNAALQEVGLFEKVAFGSDMIRYIIEHYTGGEQGVRELKRGIQTVVSKINLLRFFNNPKTVPFALKDFQLPFTVKKEHIELFLKRKNSIDPSIAHLYC